MDKINIKNKREAIKQLNRYKCKHILQESIRFSNTSLKKLNNLVGYGIFMKNDLFADSDTLFDLMQPLGGRGIHNYHDLSPALIIDILNSIIEPYCIFKEGVSRYAIVTTKSNINNETIMVVIAVKSATARDMFASVNKLVTMFPKKKISSYIEKIDKSQILYKNDFLLIKK